MAPDPRLCHEVSFARLFGVTNFKGPHKMTYQPELTRKHDSQHACKLCLFLEECLPSGDRKMNLIQLNPVLATEALCLSVTDRDPTYAWKTAIYAQVVTGTGEMSVNIWPDSWDDGVDMALGSIVLDVPGSGASLFPHCIISGLNRTQTHSLTSCELRNGQSIAQRSQ